MTDPTQAQDGSTAANFRSFSTAELGSHEGHNNSNLQHSMAKLVCGRGTFFQLLGKQRSSNRRTNSRWLFLGSNQDTLEWNSQSHNGIEPKNSLQSRAHEPAEDETSFNFDLPIWSLGFTKDFQPGQREEDFESVGAHGSVSPNSKDATGSDALLQRSREQQAEFPSNSNLLHHEHDMNGNGGNPGKKRNGEPLFYHCTLQPAVDGSGCSPASVDNGKKRMTGSEIPAHVNSPPQTAPKNSEHYRAQLDNFITAPYLGDLSF
jgi:hypothetical protein